MADGLLDTRHLILVQAIAEEGSVTRAAIRLNISQPALSHALAEVESRLGAQLFARSRRMTPTSAGERVLATAARVLEELDVLRQALSGPAAASAVRVSTSCYTAYPWLPAVLAELSRARRAIDLRIVLDATRVPLQALVRRSIDLALTTETTSRRDLLVAHLFDDELVALVSPKHALAARKYITPAELARERLLVYDAPLASLDVWRMFLRPARVRPRDVARIPLTEAIIELARAGQGIGVLARWAVEPAAARGDIVTRRLGPAGVSRTWSAIRRNNDGDAAAIDAVVAAIRKHAPARLR